MSIPSYPWVWRYMGQLLDNKSCKSCSLVLSTIGLISRDDRGVCPLINGKYKRGRPGPKICHLTLLHFLGIWILHSAPHYFGQPTGLPDWSKPCWLSPVLLLNITCMMVCHTEQVHQGHPTLCTANDDMPNSAEHCLIMTRPGQSAILTE